MEGDYFSHLFLEASDLGPAALLHLDDVPPRMARRLNIGEELVPDLQGQLGDQNKGRIAR